MNYKEWRLWNIVVQMDGYLSGKNKDWVVIFLNICYHKKNYNKISFRHTRLVNVP